MRSPKELRKEGPCRLPTPSQRAKKTLGPWDVDRESAKKARALEKREAHYYFCIHEAFPNALVRPLVLREPGGGDLSIASIQPVGGGATGTIVGEGQS